MLYVGSLNERKGAGQLLEAFIHLPEAAGVALHFVGGGPLEAELRQQVKALGPHAAGLFLGSTAPRGSAALLCPGRDVIFVFPSLYEPWGLVLNEAMACGPPGDCLLPGGRHARPGPRMASTGWWSIRVICPA